MQKKRLREYFTGLGYGIDHDREPGLWRTEVHRPDLEQGARTAATHRPQRIERTDRN